MQNIKLMLKRVVFLSFSLSFLLLGVPRDTFGHGADLKKKEGGPAGVEIGPHGGAVIDIGDGHFELTRENGADLSLYRLDEDLKTIPAEDVDSAELYVLLPGGKVVNLAMHSSQSASEPLHFVVSPKITARGGYLAVVSVSMGKESRNLRFQVS